MQAEELTAEFGIAGILDFVETEHGLVKAAISLVDIGGAGEPGNCDAGDIGNRKVGAQRLLENDRMRRAVLHGEAQ